MSTLDTPVDPPPGWQRQPLEPRRHPRGPHGQPERPVAHGRRRSAIADRLEAHPHLHDKVEFEVVGHLRGDKIVVFKMKRRKRYRRTHGHRQELTRVKVKQLSVAQAVEA